jgi:hypothetical protein
LNIILPFEHKNIPQKIEIIPERLETDFVVILNSLWQCSLQAAIVPNFAFKHAQETQPQGQIEEYNRIGSGHAYIQSRMISAADYPTVATDKFVLNFLPTISGGDNPAGMPEKIIKVINLS